MTGLDAKEELAKLIKKWLEEGKSWSTFQDAAELIADKLNPTIEIEEEGYIVVDWGSPARARYRAHLKIDVDLGRVGYVLTDPDQ